MDSSTETPVSNAEFGRAVGVHFTTASRYRNGERVPSTGVALKIANTYGLDAHDILEAIAAGRDQFGHFLRVNVFGPELGIDVDENGEEKPGPYNIDQEDHAA